MADLPKETGHCLVYHGIVSLLLHLFLDLLGRLLFPLSKSKLQEVVRSSLLGCLFLKDVLEEILVTLDQSLRVDLSMLDLLFSISLDTLKEGLKALLLLLPQLFHFLHQGKLEILVLYLSLIHLLLLDHHSHRLCLVIVLDSEIDLLLLSHLDKVLASALLHDEVFGHLLFVKDELLLLLHFQLFN